MGADAGTPDGFYKRTRRERKSGIADTCQVAVGACMTTKLYQNFTVFDQILPNTEIGRTKGAEIGIKPV
jgi:hypothetical protein